MKSKQHRVRLKVELKSRWAGKTFSYRNIPLSTSAPLTQKVEPSIPVKVCSNAHRGFAMFPLETMHPMSWQLSCSQAEA
jgi:hypothetical protein